MGEKKSFLSCVAFCRQFFLYHSFPHKMKEGSTEVNKCGVTSESHSPGLDIATERHNRGDCNKEQMLLSSWKLWEIFGVWSLGKGHCAPSQSC